MLINNEIWLRKIRNYAGLLGGLLPWISLFGALIYAISTGTIPAEFWQNLSISATYYVTPALAGILTAASLVLMCYNGYDLQDSIVTKLSGVFGIMIVLFPCSCAVSPERAGYFQLPVNVSDIVHCTSACIFFCLLAYNDLFLFTKTDNKDNMTDEKKKRNIVYKVCGIGMTLSMVLMLIPVHFTAKIWWVELFALSFFAFSWLVKGGAFKRFNDKEELL